MAIFCTCVINERNKSNRVTEFKSVFFGESQVPQLVANPRAAWKKWRIYSAWPDWPSRFIFKPWNLWMRQIVSKRKCFLQLNRHWWPVTAMWKAAKTLWSKRTFFSKPGRFPQSSPHKPLKAVHAQQLRKKFDFIDNGKQIMVSSQKLSRRSNFWENRTWIKSRKWMILSFRNGRVAENLMVHLSWNAGGWSWLYNTVSE